MDDVLGVHVKRLLWCWVLMIWPCWGWAVLDGRTNGSDKPPVAFVLASTPNIVVTNTHRRTYEVLPLQRFVDGHVLVLPKGARLSLVMLSSGQRRVYQGPAKLQVGNGLVFVRSGGRPKVAKLLPDQQALIRRWMEEYPRRGNRPERNNEHELGLVWPQEGELLLTRSPEFVFKGALPKDANFLLFDAQERRLWVQPFDHLQFGLPNALELEWGQHFSWEIRKPTGGRLLSGSFRIASEANTRALLDDRLPEAPRTPPESLLMYGMRLQLVGAYQEAQSVWEDLGFHLDHVGRPGRVER